MTVEQSRTYEKRFPGKIVRRAIALLDEMGLRGAPNVTKLTTKSNGRGKSHANLEDFLEQVEIAHSATLYRRVTSPGGGACALRYFLDGELLTVTAECEHDLQAAGLLNLFDESLDQAFYFQSKPFKIFIGHGGRDDWKELRDRLRDDHKFTCIYFEADERAGLEIKSAVEEMLEQASFALLVLTAEDDCNGKMRGRQNVIHEAGLFQAKLGFRKAIVLKEEGVENFSNIAGIVYVPFPKGSIANAVGKILSVMNREFPNLDSGHPR